MASSHPYEEPSLTTILTIFGFLFLLNIVNKVLDSLLYCGLVGQIFVGVLFGTPGAKLLSTTVETTVSDLGYLGLILLVYEGGLSTSFSGLISSATLAIVVALTGILLPIALSFVLVPFGASPLQCFAAGASLSATSLGTAFATLSTSGLLNTHVGTVLASAAMLDDVIGLIMLQVVAELSGGHGTAGDYGKVIGRALGASVGLVIVVVAICRLASRPLYTLVSTWACSPKQARRVKLIWDGPYTVLCLHTALLLTLVVTGSLAGTSLLLAAFIAGMVVRWWGDEISGSNETTGLQIYDQYYAPSADRILKPFFFASIGFSIPISQMFRAATVWKGLVYALLMFLGKLATGLWLVPSSLDSATRLQILQFLKSLWHRKQNTLSQRTGRTAESIPNGMKTDAAEGNADPRDIHPSPPGVLTVSHLSPRTVTPIENGPDVTTPQAPTESRSLEVVNTPSSQAEDIPVVSGSVPQDESNSPAPSLTTTQPRAPSGLTSAASAGPPPRRALRSYAPALLGLAMTARGEIGFLIASIAESRGIFAAPQSTSENTTAAAASDGDVDVTSTLYLIVVWAIVLCTVVGPIAVGGLVRRVKRLDMQARA